MKSAGRPIRRAGGDKGGRTNQASRPARSSFILRPSSSRAFSLIELLIVIGIIILVIAMAVPAFNLISGTRSVDAAENLLGVMLGRARTEAIGVQQVRGVMFYIDPATQRVNVTLVRVVDPATAPAPIYDVDFYLDLVPDGDTIPLPMGIGVQVVDDPSDIASGTANDRFIGYNTVHSAAPPAARIQYGGVILFDSRGQLLSRSYAFKCRSNSLAQPYFTQMGMLLLQPTEAEMATLTNAIDIVPSKTGNLGTQRSAVGVIVFDNELFRAIDDNSPTDPQISGGAYVGAEQNEETWLDQNGSALLINRYNGTLIKGE